MYVLYHFLTSFRSWFSVDEQVLGHVNTKPADANSLPARSVSQRLLPISPPTQRHNAKHITIDDYKASKDHTGTGRYEVPSPQRARGDGSGQVYTKLPEYARNYDKTNNKPAKDETGGEKM